MPFTAWKHEERNRHRDRQMYIQKFRRLRDSFKMPVNIILKSLPSNYLKTLVNSTELEIFNQDVCAKSPSFGKS